MSLAGKFINYLKETKVELKHVNWPTKTATVNFTLLVIAISFAVSLYLGFFDKIFSYFLNTFIF